MKLNPVFEDLSNSETLLNHVKELIKQSEPIPHAEILTQLIEQFEPLDFEALVFPQIAELRTQLKNLSPESEQTKMIVRQLDKLKVVGKHFLVLSA